MKRLNRLPVNDIEHCLSQAQHLNIRHPLRRIFSDMAGDETTGLIAYAIWRERSNILSTVYRASDNTLSEASKSGASQARSCWHKDAAAFDDLPRQRRPGSEQGESAPAQL